MFAANRLCRYGFSKIFSLTYAIYVHKILQIFNDIFYINSNISSFSKSSGIRYSKRHIKKSTSQKRLTLCNRRRIMIKQGEGSREKMKNGELWRRGGGEARFPTPASSESPPLNENPAGAPPRNMPSACDSVM